MLQSQHKCSAIMALSDACSYCQRALFAYEDAWIQSSRNLDINLVALYKALGGGWEENRPSDYMSAP